MLKLNVKLLFFLFFLNNCNSKLIDSKSKISSNQSLNNNDDNSIDESNRSHVLVIGKMDPDVKQWSLLCQGEFYLSRSIIAPASCLVRTSKKGSIKPIAKKNLRVVYNVRTFDIETRVPFKDDKNYLNVRTIHLHDEFIKNNQFKPGINDIAILELRGEQKEHTNQKNTMNTIVTWGPIENPIPSKEHSDEDEILRLDHPIGLQVYDIIPSPTDCKQDGYNNDLTKNLCFDSTSFDELFGDKCSDIKFGARLFIDNKGSRGSANWSLGACQSDYIGTFTLLAPHYAWIMKKTESLRDKKGKL